MKLAQRVREILHFDPKTGIFTRRVRLAQRHQVGARADFLVRSGKLAGYHRVSFDGRRYLAHRIAWLYVHSEMPEQIDHWNGIKSDNRIANLRQTTHALNIQNQRKAKKSSRSGFLGVYKSSPAHRNWTARIQVNGRGHHLGCFATAEEAHEAYVRAKRKMHEACTL